MAANPPHQQRPKLPYGKAIGRYKVIKCVGQGGYGDIYYVTSSNSNFPLAMKFELTNARKQALRKEHDFMAKVQGSIHFPRIVAFVEEEKYRYLVMEMLGPSVSNLRRCCPNQQFSFNTTLQVARMTLKIIEEFHDKGLIHRDIKPSNFLLRPGSVEFLCLIDYGLSKIYIDFTNNELLEQLDHAGFKGTLKYASPFTHYGDDQGRRDDLFSWFYSVVELYTGKLPWAEVKGRTHVLKAKKKYRKSEDIRLLPTEFQDILKHIEHLKFFDKPDYEYIDGLLDGLFDSYNLDRDEPLDWEELSDDVVKKVSIFPVRRTDKFAPFPIEDIVSKEAMERSMRRQERRQQQEDDVQKKRQKEESRKRNATSVVCLLI